VRGTVRRGRGTGSTLGFPTANLATDPYAALPASGVYAGRVDIDGAIHAAAVSIGVPPTYPEATDDFEVHVIGHDGDLLGRSLIVEFLDRLRDQVAFADTAALSRAIALDVEAAERVAG
jgi:riboflavin kinase/FMN adenylyltransferase